MVERACKYSSELGPPPRPEHCVGAGTHLVRLSTLAFKLVLVWHKQQLASNVRSKRMRRRGHKHNNSRSCLLYTSDAADDTPC
eukprot:4876303-Amphidinium_carterae.1